MTDWHMSPALLRAYADGRTGPADSWSAEAHLTACPMCRAELAMALTPADRELLAGFRAGLSGPAGAAGAAGAARSLPPQNARPPRLRVPVYWRLVLRPGALGAAVVALVAAVMLDQFRRHVLGGAGGGLPGRAELFWLLAPVLPLAGIALCAVGERDPCREAVLAAPSSGLRLTLWRTALVLGVAIPLATVTGLVLGGPGPARWLLPCLALSATALALGTVLPLERSALLVAGVWGVVVAGPATITAGGRLAGSVPASRLDLVADPAILGPAAQPAWAALALAAAAVLFVRRTTYEQLPAAAGKRTQ